MSVECSGTSFSLHLSELNDPKLTNEEWLLQVENHCSSSDFQQRCHQAGMIGPEFEWREPGKHLKQRFFDACRANSNADQSAAVVFHGTADRNIKNILKSGLDPKKRRGQAYGPGEYFGKDPGTSSGYCHGCKRMCVFFVIVPRLRPVESQSANVATIRPPYEMIVVEQNHHQLPIGILKFSSVDAQVMAAAQRSKSLLQQLNIEAMEKEKAAKVASIKARIIQLIIQCEFELAGSIYNQHKSQFSQVCKKEIAIYAYEGYDEEFVSYYFEGGLPEPKKGLANQEFHSSKTRSVESLSQDWHEAVSKLDNVASRGNEALPLFAQQRTPANQGTLPRNLVTLPNQSVTGDQQNISRGPGRAASAAISSERDGLVDILGGEQKMLDKSKAMPLVMFGQIAADVGVEDGSGQKMSVANDDRKLLVGSSGQFIQESSVGSQFSVTASRIGSPLRRSSMDDDELSYQYSTDDNTEAMVLEALPLEEVECNDDATKSGVAAVEETSLLWKSQVSNATPAALTEAASQCSTFDDESSYHYSSDGDMEL